LNIAQSEELLQFEGKIKLLKEELRGESRIGILIDNIECLLDKDSKFIDANYEKLLSIVSDPLVNSLTLITSRILLKYNSNKIENYHISDLLIDDWEKYFNAHQIKFDDQNLKSIHNFCQGNAKMMDTIKGDVTEDYEKNLDEYWKINQGNISLNGLIENQFNRLNLIHLNVYKLLCFLGCYTKQQIPKHHVIKLARDISQTENLEQALKNRCILNLKLDIYYLHNLFRSEARDRLKISYEDWIRANKKVAQLYHEDAIKLSGQGSERINVSIAFKAFYHYYEAQEFEECHKVILQILEADGDIENLRCSENLWCYASQIVKECAKLSEVSQLSGLSKISRAVILIPLGVLYPEIGKPHKGVEISEIILNTIKDIPLSPDNSERIIFAKISAYIISARSNRTIGNFKLGEKACENAIKLTKKKYHYLSKTKLNYWRALSIYELGNVCLERTKVNGDAIYRFIVALKPIYYYVNSAFLAIDKRVEWNKILQILTNFFNPRNANQRQKRMKDLVDENESLIRNTSRDGDKTKYFRIIYNTAQCINLMKLDLIANGVLVIAEKYLINSVDIAWWNIEMALCSPDLPRKKKEDHYRTALELEEKGKLTELCSTALLFSYGNFLYDSRKYREAMKIYIQLEKKLDLTGFELLKMSNYYKICQTWLELDEDENFEEEYSIPSRNTKFTYLQKCKNICDEFRFDFYEKRIKYLEKGIY
jgi:hypothetical protein